MAWQGWMLKSMGVCMTTWRAALGRDLIPLRQWVSCFLYKLHNTGTNAAPVRGDYPLHSTASQDDSRSVSVKSLKRLMTLPNQ